MSRTIPSVRVLLEGIVVDLSVFHRALSRDDKAVFDSLLNKARKHASLCTVVPLLKTNDAIFLSIIVEQEKEISELKDVIKSEKQGNIKSFNLRG